MCAHRHSGSVRNLFVCEGGSQSNNFQDLDFLLTTHAATTRTLLNRPELLPFRGLGIRPELAPFRGTRSTDPSYFPFEGLGLQYCSDPFAGSAGFWLKNPLMRPLCKAEVETAVRKKS